MCNPKSKIENPKWRHPRARRPLPSAFVYPLCPPAHCLCLFPSAHALILSCPSVAKCIGEICGSYPSNGHFNRKNPRRPAQPCDEIPRPVREAELPHGGVPKRSLATRVKPRGDPKTRSRLGRTRVRRSGLRGAAIRTPAILTSPPTPALPVRSIAFLPARFRTVGKRGCQRRELIARTRSGKLGRRIRKVAWLGQRH
jgi:hypothetical protein